jgi:hypothetical protein
MSVVSATFEMRKPRIADLNEGPGGLASGVSGAGVMVVLLWDFVFGSLVQGCAKRIGAAARRAVPGGSLARNSDHAEVALAEVELATAAASFSTG